MRPEINSSMVDRRINSETADVLQSHQKPPLGWVSAVTTSVAATLSRDRATLTRSPSACACSPRAHATSAPPPLVVLW